MLEIAKILRDIDNLGRERAALYSGLGDELLTAETVISRVSSDLTAAADRISQARTSWLTTTFSEPPNMTYPLPELPDRHAVVSSDGSQIMPDKHEVTFCYLINASHVILYYGTGERPEAAANPILFYRDEDLFEEHGGRRVSMNDKLIGIRRTLAEADELEKAIRTAARDGLPVAALWDGSLIRWALESEPPDYRDRILNEYLSLFEVARKLGIPVAGYISDPGSKDFVNSMRVMLCDQEVVDCDKCPYTATDQSAPCDAVARLKDSIVFKKALEGGMRTVMFSSDSRILDRYGDHRVQAFYMDAGREIVRVEVPEWVAKDEDLLRLTHAVCWDQAQKGRGYPVALAEAHEHAVVRGPERKAFYDLIERSFVKHGARVSTSLKRQSKGY